MSNLIEYTPISNEIAFWECARDLAIRDDIGYAYMKEDGNFQNVLNVDALLLEYERDNLYTFKKETCFDRARRYLLSNMGDNCHLTDLIGGQARLEGCFTRKQLIDFAKAVIGDQENQ